MRLIFPSNSSSKYFPENTQANFITKLPEERSLVGDWEVGLEEIQYPRNWRNVEVDDVWGLYTFNNKTCKCVIEPGLYTSGRRLVGAFTRAFRIKGQPKRVTFTFDTRDEKITMSVPLGGKVQFSESAKALTGFVEHDYTGLERNTQYQAERAVDLRGGLYTLYVYCDLIEPHIVGDAIVPLLRPVSTRGADGDVVTETYDKVQYFPLLRKTFSTTEINIRDDTGQLVSFQGGRVLITLHVRPRRS